LLAGKAEATPASEALAVGGIVWRPGCTLASVLISLFCQDKLEDASLRMRPLSATGPRGGRTMCEHTRIHKRGVDEQVGCQVTLCLASDSFHPSASPLLQSTFPLHVH
jgi:hypothetical protein